MKLNISTFTKYLGTKVVGRPTYTPKAIWKLICNHSDHKESLMLLINRNTKSRQLR